MLGTDIWAANTFDSFRCAPVSCVVCGSGRDPSLRVLLESWGKVESSLMKKRENPEGERWLTA